MSREMYNYLKELLLDSLGSLGEASDQRRVCLDCIAWLDKEWGNRGVTTAVYYGRETE